jgi:carbon monoxide dehydrogenase subunit G
MQSCCCRKNMASAPSQRQMVSATASEWVSALGLRPGAAMLHPDGMSFSSRTRPGATILFLACALCVPAAAPAQQISIETTGHGDLVSVTASAELHVDPRTAWNVISDYDHLAEFIPDMRSSRVLLRHGDELLVEQKGEFGFLFFRQPVDVKLAVIEYPPRQIVARAVGGNLREMEGRYELEILPAGVRLSYFGRLVPEFSLPPIIGRMVVRSVLAKQFTAMVKEILRRDALARSAPQPR